MSAVALVAFVRTMKYVLTHSNAFADKCGYSVLEKFGSTVP